MNAPAPWVTAALAPRGPSRAELLAATEHARIARDAMELGQWETAFEHCLPLYEFAARELARVRTGILAKRAAKKFARREKV